MDHEWPLVLVPDTDGNGHQCQVHGRLSTNANQQFTLQLNPHTCLTVVVVTLLSVSSPNVYMAVACLDFL